MGLWTTRRNESRPQGHPPRKREAMSPKWIPACAGMTYLKGIFERAGFRIQGLPLARSGGSPSSSAGEYRGSSVPES